MLRYRCLTLRFCRPMSTFTMLNLYTQNAYGTNINSQVSVDKRISMVHAAYNVAMRQTTSLGLNAVEQLLTSHQRPFVI